MPFRGTARYGTEHRNIESKRHAFRYHFVSYGFGNVFHTRDRANDSAPYDGALEAEKRR